MLLEFGCKNVLSIGNEILIDFRVNKQKIFGNNVIYNDKGKKVAVKYASIYGPNNSGKSNILKAMDLGRNLVISRKSKDVSIKSAVNKNSTSNIVDFLFRINIDNQEYLHEFSYNSYDRVFVSERLYKTDKLLLNRCINTDGAKIDYTNILKKSLSEIHSEEELQYNIKRLDEMLYLDKDTSIVESLYEYFIRNKSSEIDRVFKKNMIDTIKAVYYFYNRKLRIIYTDTQNYSHVGRINEYMDNETNSINEIEHILRCFGTGITSVYTEEIKYDDINEKLEIRANKFLDDIKESPIYNVAKEIAEKLPEHEARIMGGAIFRLDNEIYSLSIDLLQGDSIESLLFEKIRFKQGKMNFSINELSLGTQRLIELLDLFLARDEEVTILIDEIDRSFHTALTKHIINEFCRINKKSQLIATTHDVNLMDINDFRQDQLIFADRDFDFNTVIKHLTEFDIRKDKKIVLDYLNGRYGSIPNLNEIEIPLENKSVKVV